MKHIFGAFLLVFLISGTSRAVDFDTSLLPLCLELADNPANEALRSRLLAHKHIKLISEGLPTHRSVSFNQISEHKDRLNGYAEALPMIAADLPVLTTQATELLNEGAAPADLNIRIVCGPPYDAFGFTRDGKTHLFVNLPLIKPDFFPYLLRHEIWHAAFRNQYPGVASDFETSKDPLKRLTFIMLNEGVGHYYSFQRRVEPRIAYDNWPERTESLFSLLQEKAQLLAAASSLEQEETLLWTSEAGVPFWEKWGAVTGAVITYRLKNKLSTAAVASLVAQGPCGFLSRYQDEANQMPDWEPIPAILLDAACKAS